MKAAVQMKQNGKLIASPTRIALTSTGGCGRKRSDGMVLPQAKTRACKRSDRMVFCVSRISRARPARLVVASLVVPLRVSFKVVLSFERRFFVVLLLRMTVGDGRYFLLRRERSLFTYFTHAIPAKRTAKTMITGRTTV